MAIKEKLRCPVCGDQSMILGVDGKAEPCSRGCRKTLRLRSQKMEIKEQKAKKKANAKSKTKKSSSSSS